MTQTEQLGVYKAIASVMADIGVTGIAKGRNNAQQGYKFRGIDDVYNELNGLLSKYHLILLPNVISREQVERQTKSGGALFFTNVLVEFTLVSALDGTKATIRTVGEAMDSGDKSSNKALSAAYKYAAMMLFCIPTEADNDADAITHDVAAGNLLPPTHPNLVKNSMAEKDALCKEIDDIQSMAVLTKWKADNTTRLEGLSEQHFFTVSDSFKNKRRELSEKAAA